MEAIVYDVLTCVGLCTSPNVLFLKLFWCQSFHILDFKILPVTLRNTMMLYYCQDLRRGEKRNGCGDNISCGVGDVTEAQKELGS